MRQRGLVVVGLVLALGSSVLSASTASEPLSPTPVAMTQSEVVNHLARFHTNRTKGAKLRVLSEPPRVLFDFDDATNLAGDPDRPFLLAPGKLAAARTLVDRIVAASKAGTAPGQADAQALFDMIDPQNK